MSRDPSNCQLVSVVVRSIGRPSINRALRSVEMQDYRYIEIVVVNARAKEHPPLPCDLTLPVSLVESHRDLNRPQAANVGLDQSRGSYIVFLDDDDFFDHDHVSSLLACLRDKPDHLVAYAGTRVLDEKDEIRSVLDLPFNRLALLKNNYIQIGAALFSAQLLAYGCRFDEDMLLFQDWDFWIQACRLTPFAFTGRITANWRAFSGGSGAGLGKNLNGANNVAYTRKIHEKWAALRSRLTEKYKYAVGRGLGLLSKARSHDAQKWIAVAKSIESGKLPSD